VYTVQSAAVASCITRYNNIISKIVLSILYKSVSIYFNNNNYYILHRVIGIRSFKLTFCICGLIKSKEQC